jgi:uncharacterized protein (DUF983 family)
MIHEPSHDPESPRRWSRDTGVLPKREVPLSLMRGACHRCPSCGKGRIFRAFLKVADQCPSCDEALHHHRADDAPPYFTIVIVGKIVIPMALVAEQMYRPEIWVQTTLWTVTALVLTMLLLPAVKGALVGYQWALYMHGFDPRSGGDETWDGVGFESWRDDR